MARGQKKERKELTPEERLQNALVPKEEWPYELPEGWKWVTLGKLTDVIGGGTPSTRHLEYYEGGTIPWLSPADLSGYSDMFISRGQKNITQEGLDNSSAKLLPKGTVCLSSRAPIGYVVIAKNALCTNQGFKSFTPSEYIYPEFLYWYLKANKPMLESMASGTTFLELSGKKAGQIMMPLPSIEIQKSISLFAEREFGRLDEAQEQIQSVIDNSEERKQSILHKAFTGELTENWRKEQGKKLELTYRAFAEIAEVKSNLVDPAEYQEFPHIAPDNVEKKTGRLLEYRTISEDKVTSPKHRFYKGQIIYSKIRPYLSKVIIAPFNGLCSADMYPVETKENTRYLWYYMLSEAFLDQACSAGSRSVLPKINQKELGRIKVPIFPMDEEMEIARLLDDFFEKTEQIDDTIDNISNSVGNIKTSLLNKAFRGELHL